LMRLALVAALMVGVSWNPALAVCDLSRVVGYTLVFSKTIESYIEDGKQANGFRGCTPDRVLVFTDHSGVRCKDAGTANAVLPTAYLFARTNNDLKLCVGDDLYDVAPGN
jgi:hypothetical protein